MLLFIARIVVMHAKCGNIQLARKTFDGITHRNVVSWGALLSEYVQRGHGVLALELFMKMQGDCVLPDRAILSCILKACGSIGVLAIGMELHRQILEHGFELDVALGSGLIDMYAKCGSLEDALNIFNNLPKRNVVSWSAMIAGYTEHGLGLVALECYERMKQEGTRPDRVTFLCLMKACGSIKCIRRGRLLNDHMIRQGLESDVAIGSTTVDMYAKCGSLNEAHKVFKGLLERNEVSWNALMSGFVQNGFSLTALDLFRDMQQEGVVPTRATFLCTLKACGNIGAIEQGNLVFIQLTLDSVVSDLAIGNALVDMYVKCGRMEDARNVFNQLPKQDNVSWGSIIAGYAQRGQGLLALKLFKKMQQHGMKPDEFMFSAALKACGTTGNREWGRLLHDQLIQVGCESDMVVGLTLIDMYAKCGSVMEAHTVFDGLPFRTTMCCSAMISGYAQNGHGVVALELFLRMQIEGIQPGTVTLICALKASSSIQAIETGKHLHHQVVSDGFDSDVLVGNALLDMYTKCEYLEDAGKVFDQLKNRDVASWSTMIVGYVQNGQGLSALDMFIKMLQKGIQLDRVLLVCALKACGTAERVIIGKLIHNQVIESRQDLDVAIGNTLVDMYINNDKLEEARRVFDKLLEKDVVTFNTLIAGYAQHGYWKLALQCFAEMQSKGFKPDSCTYTGVLFACSQGGLVNEGYHYFQIMKLEHGVTPSVEHFNCMVELLGHAGFLQETVKLLHSLPILPDITGWTSLLSACWLHGEMDLAQNCFSELVKLESNTGALYVYMSNVYAHLDMQDDAYRLQGLKDFSNTWKKPGRALIEAKHPVQEFTVGDTSHFLNDNMKRSFQNLLRLLKGKGFVPKLEPM